MLFISISQKPSTKCLTTFCFLNFVISEFVGLFSPGFESYLSDRRQRVVLQGVYFEWLPVTSGVPQDSILGPLIVIVYSNDIQTYIQKSNLALFADDSKLYLPQVEPNATYNLQDDLDNLTIWTTDNQTELNNTKCKSLAYFQKENAFYNQLSYQWSYYRASDDYEGSWCDSVK